jgi:hydrogenase maturation protease
MTGRTVVAGVGNIFLADDGFGVEVANRLMRRPMPAGVEVVDVGIRAVHLAYDLLDGCDLLVLVDAAARGEQPGTVTVLELQGSGDAAFAGPAGVAVGAHDLTPESMLAMVRTMGGWLGRVVLVACEPVDVQEGIGLTDQVRAAVDVAVPLVERIVAGQEEPCSAG